METFAPKIFISYSSEDEKLIHHLNEELTNCSIETWIDLKKIKNNPGENFKDAISKALKSSHVVIIYLTESALNSAWVKEELDISDNLEKKGRIKILPFVGSMEIKNHPSFPTFLESRQLTVLTQENIHKILPIIVSKIFRIHSENRQFDSIESIDTVDYEQIVQKIKDARKSIKMMATNFHRITGIHHHELIIEKLSNGINFDLVMSDFDSLSPELLNFEISKFGTGNIDTPRKEYDLTISNLLSLKSRLANFPNKGKLTLKLTTLPITSKYYSFDSEITYVAPYFTGSSSVSCPCFKITKPATIKKYDELFDNLWEKAKEYC
jgi:hypothetical protein